jgi:hypothetical protein
MLVNNVGAFTAKFLFSANSPGDEPPLDCVGRASDTSQNGVGLRRLCKGAELSSRARAVYARRARSR